MLIKFLDDVEQASCAEFENSGNEHNEIRWELPFFTKDQVQEHKTR
jgi:hypothetical protein